MNKDTFDSFIDEIAERFAQKFFERYGGFNDGKESKESKKFATVRQIPEIYPSFSQASLRNLIFFKKTNGFSKCVKRIGRKILIDLEQFEQWIDKGGNNPS